MVRWPLSSSALFMMGLSILQRCLVGTFQIICGQSHYLFFDTNGFGSCLTRPLAHFDHKKHSSMFSQGEHFSFQLLCYNNHKLSSSKQWPFPWTRGAGVAGHCLGLSRLQSRWRPACVLNWRLDWGRTCLQVHSLLAGFVSLWPWDRGPNFLLVVSWMLFSSSSGTGGPWPFELSQHGQQRESRANLLAR